MSEDHDEPHDEVSRLLAAASGGPGASEMPDDVARRLDDVLAGLVSERAASSADETWSEAASGPALEGSDASAGGGAAGDSAAPDVGEGAGRQPLGPVPPDEVVGVTELAPRRGRRWPRLLVAAAAVSVIGLGVGTMLEGGPQFSGQSEKATAGAEHDEGAADSVGPYRSEQDAPRDSAGKPAVPDLQRDGSVVLTQGAGPPRLRSDSLTEDVQRVQDSLTPVPVSGRRDDLRLRCVRPRTGPGDQWLPVRLDGEVAVLVLRAPADGRRTAEIFTCDDPRTPAASTVVDTR